MLTVLEGSSPWCGAKAWQQKQEAEGHLQPQARSRESKLETLNLGTLKASLQRHTPPTRPHLLNLPKQHHQLGTKHTNRGLGEDAEGWGAGRHDVSLKPSQARRTVSQTCFQSAEKLGTGGRDQFKTLISEMQGSLNQGVDYLKNIQKKM